MSNRKEYSIGSCSEGESFDLSRSQVKTFTLAPSRDLISKYATHIGFEFQFRVVWTGNCEVTRVVAHASPLDESVYAHRVWDDACVPEDVA